MATIDKPSQTATEDGIALGRELDEISRRQRVPSPGATAMVAKIIADHEAACVELERAEAADRRHAAR